MKSYMSLNSNQGVAGGNTQLHWSYQSQVKQPKVAELTFMSCPKESGYRCQWATLKRSLEKPDAWASIFSKTRHMKKRASYLEAQLWGQKPDSTLVSLWQNGSSLRHICYIWAAYCRFFCLGAGMSWWMQLFWGLPDSHQ